MIIIDLHILLGNKKKVPDLTLALELSRALVGGGISFSSNTALQPLKILAQQLFCTASTTTCL
jgi:hypothetical protein